MHQWLDQDEVPEYFPKTISASKEVGLVVDEWNHPLKLLESRQNLKSRELLPGIL